jgi:hypothetical protein
MKGVLLALNVVDLEASPLNMMGKVMLGSPLRPTGSQLRSDRAGPDALSPEVIRIPGSSWIGNGVSD